MRTANFPVTYTVKGSIWLEMEKSSIKSGLSLETYLYDSDIKVLRKIKENVLNPIVYNMVRVWHETEIFENFICLMVRDGLFVLIQIFK